MEYFDLFEDETILCVNKIEKRKISLDVKRLGIDKMYNSLLPKMLNEFFENRLLKNARDAKFSDFTEDGFKKALDYCKEIKESNFKLGMFLLGSPGIGKTRLLFAILNEYLEYLISKKEDFGSDNLVVINAYEYFKASTDVYEYDSSINIPNIGFKAKNTKLLFFDDICMENLTKDSKQRFYDLLNYRELNNLPIICTTRLTEENLVAKYPEEIIDRLFNLATPYLVSGIDKRKEQKEVKKERKKIN